jgi:nickel/cobalt transporter (NicO) family protein
VDIRGQEERAVKKLVVTLGALAALIVPTAAAAHPLGNFTTNRFSRVEVSGHRLYVLYVLDLAEIPTFQAGKIDARRYARRIAAGVRLQVDGARVPLVPAATALAHPEGAGGLRTTRLEVALRGPRLSGPSDIRYRDTNYAERIGWKEIVVGRKAPSPSRELRAYPEDRLQSPPDVTAVAARLVPRGGPETPPPLGRGRALQEPDRIADSGFASLIGRDRLGAWIVLASLGAAFFWGAAHALSPGHGKTIVAAYLVGQRGTPRHALLLGLIVTATHTVGVFALGLVTLLLSQWVVPETLYPWLTLASGLLVVGIGGSVLRSRWRQRRTHGEGLDHHHPHHHHGERGHDGELSLRSLLAVGVTGGLLPCPSALVVLLAAISLHRVAFGLILILAFSAGLALVITAIGLTAVHAKRAFSRLSFEGRLVSLLPAASALVIVVAGVAMTAHAVPDLG